MVANQSIRMMRFVDKTVLITGGGRGIGRACAQRFRAEGARVILAQRSQVEDFDTVFMDLQQPESCVHVIEQAVALGGSLDILVNNAGMMQEASLEAMSLEDWNLTMTVNVTGPAMLIKHALSHLRKSKGNIVNIGSIEGLGSNPQHSAYCASKGALHALTRAVAVDHGVDGIRCNAVAPGWIDTELNTDFIESQPDPARFRQKISTIHALRRTGTPAEVAALVTWLASSEAAFVTGQIYTIDGGRMAQLSLPS